jgi:uncharacterized membrane protein
MNLCKYKDIIGKPGSGLRKYRIFDIAIIDTVVTIIGAYLIALYFKLPILYTIISIFILGIISHRIFCVRTGLDKKLFP